MKKLLVMSVAIAGFAGQAIAQEEAPRQMPMAQKQIDPMTLRKDAVRYATIADAYNAYCSENQSAMASDYLDQFDLDENVTIEQKAELVGVMEEEVQIFLQKITNEKPNCADVEFALGRLDAMRKLKDVSYLLNGIDPATQPDGTMPELRELLKSYERDGVVQSTAHEGEDVPSPVE